MQNKLASLFTLIALVTLITTWFLRWIFSLPHMRPELGLTIFIVCMIVYFMFGKAVSWIGMSLIQEELSEKRAREDELRHQLAMLETEAKKSNGSSDSAPAPEAPASDAPAEEKPAAPDSAPAQEAATEGG